MYKTKHVHYKTIFKQNGQSETIEYKEKGILRMGDQTQLIFHVDNETIDITYGNTEIILKHGNSVLRFHSQQEIWNQYQLPYGVVHLKTKLLKFEANEDRIKMKYELYDQTGLISTAFLLITMIPYSFQEEV